jgi:DNA-directed RNA polymerase specialized sigma24 family protein
MTTKNPSQTELYGQMLTSEQQYRKEIAPFRSLSPEQIQALLDAIKAGDEQARSCFLMSLTGYVERWAYRFSRVYDWESSRIEYQELISVGNMAIVEQLDKALCKDDTWGYLAATAKFRMLKFCHRYASPIRTPNGQQPYRVESLDEPIGYDTDTTYAQCLAEPVAPIWYSSLHIADEEISQAIERLGDKQRHVIQHLFALGECDRRQVVEIGKEQQVTSKTIQSLRETAFIALRRFLESDQKDLYTVPQACEVLGCTQARFLKLASRHGIVRVAKGYYPKQQVDVLVEQERSRKPYPSVGRKQDTCKVLHGEEVYSKQYANMLLGMNKHRFYALLEEYGIHPVARGYYRKQDIDTLLERRQEQCAS